MSDTLRGEGLRACVWCLGRGWLRATRGQGTIMANPPGCSQRDPAQGQKVAVSTCLSCVLICLAMLRAGALVRGHGRSPDIMHAVSAVANRRAAARMTGAGTPPAWGSSHPAAAGSPPGFFFSPNTGID